MKKLLTLFLSILIAVSALSANRYATSGDVATYATTTNGQLKLNDYIIDTPFSTSGGLGQIYITNVGTLMSSLPAGGTIWLDAASLPDLFNLYITNESAGTTWDNGSSPDNPVKIRPLGGQIATHMTAASNTARMWLIADIANVEVNGYLPAYPGMKHNWTGALANTFGFVIDGGTVLNDDPFQLMIDGDHAGMESIAIKNIEIAHGYCALRIMPGNTNLTLSRFTCERAYFHDTLGGEMFYVGQTTGTPFALFEEVIVRDVICARSNTEAIQLQHLVGTSARSYVENFVVTGAAAGWKNPFQQYQDNGIQYATDNGPNTMRNFIMDGAANTQLSILPYPDTPSGDPIIIENGLLTDGRYIGVYTGGSASGSDWILRDLYFKDFNDTYPELSEGSTANYVISENNSDYFAWHHIVKDNTRTNLFQDASGQEVIGAVVDNAMDDIEYRVPAFPGKTTEQYEFYTEEYASWSTRAGDKVAYSTGDIVGRPVVGTGFRFYLCTSGHTSSGSTHPESDGTHWSVITWDAEGDPSYDGDWDSGDAQTYYGWDDYRLVSNSTWNQLGMGLRSNELNTNYTYFQWFTNSTASESGMQELAGERSLTFERSSEDVGNYIRLKAYVKESGGSITEKWVNDWFQVN